MSSSLGQSLGEAIHEADEIFHQFIPLRKHELNHVKSKHGFHSWRHKTLEFIHSKPVQITLMVLLILDVLVLFMELFLDAEFPHCRTIVRDAISCCPHEETTRFLADDHGVCEPPLVDSPEYPAGCDDHKYPAVHTAHTVLFSVTITILSIFMIELILLIICLGPKTFFRHWWYVLDLFIVSVSLALEITLKVLHEDELAALVGLLVLSRIWRFVRIGHGLVEVTAEVLHDQHVKEQERRKEGTGAKENDGQDDERQVVIDSAVEQMEKKLEEYLPDPEESPEKNEIENEPTKESHQPNA